MTNQHIGQQNHNNNSLAERVYAFKDLPQDVREKLLRMQSSDGEFLKTGNRSIFARIFSLAILVFPLILFFPRHNSPARLQDQIGFSVICIMLSVWIVYIVWTLLITLTSPLKNRAYLTTTQLVAAEDGMIRWRELKDVGEMKIKRFRARNQSFYQLHLIFDDSDFYEYKCFVRGTAKQQATVNNWREKAEAWKIEAVGAFQRGDAAYFNSHDVFQKTAMANVPVRKRKSRKALIIALLIITFALPVSGYLFYLPIK